jgi:hypothetical protein
MKKSALQKYTAAIGAALSTQPDRAPALTTAYPLDAALDAAQQEMFKVDSHALTGYTEGSLHHLYLTLAAAGYQGFISKVQASTATAVEAEGTLVPSPKLTPCAPNWLAVLQQRLAVIERLALDYGVIDKETGAADIRRPGALVADSILGPMDTGAMWIAGNTARIAVPALLRAKHFAQWRKNATGGIRSWISNTLNTVAEVAEQRLPKVRRALARVPDEIWALDYLTAPGVERNVTLALARAYDAAAVNAKRAARRIIRSKARPDDIDTINAQGVAHIALADPLGRINGALAQHAEAVAAGKKITKTFWKKHPGLARIDTPKLPPKLSRDPSRVAEPDRVAAAAVEHDTAITTLREVTPQVTVRLEVRAFHNFVQAMKRLPGGIGANALKRLQGSGVVDPEHLRLFMVEDKGIGFWKHERSTSPRNPYPVTEAALADFDPLPLVGHLLGLAKRGDKPALIANLMAEKARLSARAADDAAQSRALNKACGDVIGSAQRVFPRPDVHTIQLEKGDVSFAIVPKPGRVPLSGRHSRLEPVLVGGEVDVLATFVKAAVGDVGALQALPHNWWLGLPLRTGGSDITEGAVVFDAAGQPVTARKARGLRWFRLRGPSSMMRNIGRVAAGQMVAQGPKLILKDGILQANIPFAGQDISPLPLKFGRVMGVDVGEYGIGYGVIDIATGALVTSGVVPLKAGALLRRMAKDYRERKQTAGRFDRIRGDHRRAKRVLAGQMVGVIQNLMFQHRALPVFEATVGNLQRGDQMARLWNDVVVQFTGGDTDADRTARNTAWQAKVVGSTTLLPRWQWRTREGKRVPPPFRPGATVSGAYTSTTCRHCRVSVLGQLKDAQAVTVAAGVAVTDTGFRFTLPGGGDGAFPAGDVYALIRPQIRFHPTERGEADSTKSSFRCFNLDCSQHGVEQHSDESAAIELARRAVDRMMPASGADAGVAWSRSSSASRT